MINNKHSFTEEQIEYLTSNRTLNRWATKSLEERVQLFKKRYPHIHMTVYKLRKLYSKYKVRKKVIRSMKTPNRAKLDDIAL